MTISESNATVPQNMERIIREKGLKQNAVAQWAGYTNQQFTDMLNGRRLIKPRDVITLAKAVGVDIGELFQSGE